MKILVWKRHPDAKLPEKSTEGSVGYDLFALEETEIPPRGLVFLRTGLVIKAEPPFALFVFPRSSLFKKKGLIMPNSAGIIDFDYCGEDDEVKIPLLNLTDKTVRIVKGEKVAQAVFIRVEFPEVIEVSKPPSRSSRGGFGSTGGYNEA